MKRYLTFNLGLVGYFLLFSFILLNRLHAQVSLQWADIYKGPANNGAGFSAMVLDDSGNLYVTGSATIKYNSSGAKQWVSSYNFNNQDFFSKAIAMDHQGNIYVTGSTSGIGTELDFTTIKYNNAGVQQWVARYDGPHHTYDYVSAIAVDGSGNVYVTGTVEGPNGSADYATVKYNTNGVQQWVQLWDGAGHYTDEPLAIAVNPVTHDVYVTGYSAEAFIYGSYDSEDYATIKYNTNGVLQWVRIYNGPANNQDNAQKIALDPSGNIYVTGWSGTGMAADIATIKYNSDGVEQWVKRYNGPSNSVDQPTAMKVDNQGNVYITGFTDNGTNSADCVTIKYDSSGVEKWVQLYNEPSIPPYNTAEVAYAVAFDNGGNVYIAGQISGGVNSIFDYLTVKYNSAGVLQWAEHYDGFNNYDLAQAVEVDKFNNVYVGGRIRKLTSWNSDTNYIGILKYVQTAPLHVNAGPDTTIYYGYGSGCTNLKAIASGGVLPYTYSWLPAGNNPTDSINTVCPKITTSYIVTVTDANQSTATDTVKVNVINVRCGNKKVLICHKGITLCIGEEAVAMHLKHGDKLGMCQLKLGCHISNGFIVENGNDQNQPVQLFALPKENNDESLTGKISNYPNPFTSATTINYVLPFDAHVSIKVYDMLGKQVAVVVNENKKAGNYNVLFNASHLTSGTYQCNLIATSKDNHLVQSVKLNIIR